MHRCIVYRCLVKLSLIERRAKIVPFHTWNRQGLPLSSGWNTFSELKWIHWGMHSKGIKHFHCLISCVAVYCSRYAISSDCCSQNQANCNTDSVHNCSEPTWFYCASHATIVAWKIFNPSRRYPGFQARWMLDLNTENCHAPGRNIKSLWRSCGYRPPKYDESC